MEQNVRKLPSAEDPGARAGSRSLSGGGGYSAREPGGCGVERSASLRRPLGPSRGGGTWLVL